MESSLDTTAEVYMTPLTVDEIKKVLTADKSARKIHRRNTLGDLQPSRIVFPDSSTAEIYRHLERSEDDSFVSEYFTAQEILTSNVDSDVHIIDSDTSGCEFINESPNLKDSTNIRSSGGSEKFNTTLEEIEKLLNSSSIQASEISDASSYLSQVQVKEPLASIGNLQSPKVCSNRVHEEQIEKTPTNFKSPKIFSSKLPSRQKEFKVPATKLFSKSPSFKNIVSPVATYIKRSPQVPLVQHVPLRTLRPSALPIMSQDKGNGKENQQFTLPPVVYKPGAKSVIVSQEPQLKLPKSLAKFVSNTPKVVKHNGRYESVDKSVGQLEEMLLSEDLTLTETTLNSSHINQDISILTIKNPYT